MKTSGILIMSSLLLLAIPVLALAETYTIDQSHSSVGFSVKHMVIAKVKGNFTGFEGQFEFTPDKPDSWQVTATVDAATVNTDNEDRDTHLRSADFFDVENHPTLSFKSTGVKKVDGDDYQLTGELTMRGVTKTVVLDLEYLGSVTDPWGNQRTGFSASTKVDRKDYGLAWSKALETGGLVVGNEVEITIDIEGIMNK